MVLGQGIVRSASTKWENDAGLLSIVTQEENLPRYPEPNPSQQIYDAPFSKKYLYPLKKKMQKNVYCKYTRDVIVGVPRYLPSSTGSHLVI